MSQLNRDKQKIHFEVYGLLTSKEFQLSKKYVQTLQTRLPDEYAAPEVIPLLDLNWNMFLTKMRREIKGEKLWHLAKKVMIFKNGELLGDDDDLLSFLTSKYKYSISEEFSEVGIKQLITYIRQQKKLGNGFVYFIIAVNDHVVGTMLFELYSLLVPRTCKNFVKNCNRRVGGYTGSCIHRIAWPSWVQCGGWRLDLGKMECENYSVPHDQRGVLSMCNNGKHCNNYHQFMISLEATPWMDMKYVGFGQLIYGDDVLQTIQRIPTRYESPLKKIDIVKSGELDLCVRLNQRSLTNLTNLKQFLSVKDTVTGLHPDVQDFRDTPSMLLSRRLKEGKYSLETDTQSHMPLCELPTKLTGDFLAKINEDSTQ